MRSTVLALSMTIAVWGGYSRARAAEADELSLAQYTTTDDQFDEETGPLGLSNDPALIEVVTPRDWFNAPTYGTYFQADALFLARAHDVDRPIVVQLPSNAPRAGAMDVGLSDKFAPGAMFTLGMRLDQVAAVEATYFGLNTWRSSSQITDPGGNLGLAGTLQLATSDFIFADRMALDYKSRIDNAEINYKQTIEGLTLLAGFRFFSVNDTFNINSHNPILLESSDYHVSAVNRLIGFQGGVGYNRSWGRLNVGVLGKLGVFANLAHQQTLLRDIGNSLVVRDYRVYTTPVSVLGEIALNGTYQLTDWLAIRAGYRFIGVDNLALGPDQLDLTNSPRGTRVISAHEFLLLHGVNVGVEVRW